MMDYKQWYEQLGIHLEDKLKEWIEAIPTEIDIHDVLGDSTDFLKGTLSDAYLLYTEENDHIDMQYATEQERELLEGHCF